MNRRTLERKTEEGEKERGQSRMTSLVLNFKGF